ncbi:MAG: hypothetical protein WC028_08380 [Candidatus Obscuribacterales bacterium]
MSTVAKRSKRSNSRKRGSVTAFAAALALVLMVLGIGFIIISLYMGGQRETKNATDAGALSVGKEVLNEPSVMLTPAANQRCFLDCTNDTIDNSVIGDGRVNLNRINRVWSKAMLIAINAEDSNAGGGKGNADSAFQGAESISNALADKLTDATNLHGFFNNLSTKNSTRMIGVDSHTQVKAGAGWQTSLMDRDAESNVELTGSAADNFYLPPGFSLPGGCSTKCTRDPVPGEVANTTFLKGYAPLQIGNHEFWQVPFKWNDKPHLVSSTPFNADKASTKATTWSKPVPNAYSVEGQAINPGATAETASSWVLSNPRHPFKLAAPHSFLKIHIDQMKCHWFFYVPLKVEGFSTQNYDFTPTSLTGATHFPGGVGSVSLTPPAHMIGLDVVGRSLDDVIFGIPKGNTDKLEKYMVGRANEMISKPGVEITANKLHSILGDPATIAWLIAGEKDFYVFSKDGATLECQPKALAMGMAPTWMPLIIGEAADGNEDKLIPDANMPSVVNPPMPTSPVPIIFFTPAPPYVPNVSWVLWDKDVYWKNGTGYNGNLGEVRVKRWNEVHSVGVCIPII